MAKAQAKEQPAASPLPQVDLNGVGLGLAAITLVAATAVGFLAGVGMALLTILTGALLGAILLVWHSLRTLAGDAEVDVDLELATVHAPSDLSEKKRRALRCRGSADPELAHNRLRPRGYTG